MKKLFIAFSIIGLFALSSCGAQEECRPRSSQVYQDYHKQATENIVSVESRTELQ